MFFLFFLKFSYNLLLSLFSMYHYGILILKIILNNKNQNKPAMKGPIVNGMEQSPSKNPTAWEAPEGPQRSYAIGPSIVIKQPSKMPK